jgi:hypothetical protein
MATPRTGRRREHPLKICQACGGDWFRLGDFYEFLREETVGMMWETWPEMVGQSSPGPLTVGICLCGRPWAPRIDGVRGGYMGRVWIPNFLESLQVLTG